MTCDEDEAGAILTVLIRSPSSIEFLIQRSSVVVSIGQATKLLYATRLHLSAPHESERNITNMAIDGGSTLKRSSSLRARVLARIRVRKLVICGWTPTSHAVPQFPVVRPIYYARSETHLLFRKPSPVPPTPHMCRFGFVGRATMQPNIWSLVYPRSSDPR